MDKSAAYNILGISEGAKEEQIKAAYLELADKFAPEKYEAGPLLDEAIKKMDELNTSFDTAMSFLRTGNAPAKTEEASPFSSQEQQKNSTWQQSGTQSASIPAATPQQYADIRQRINSGQADMALAQLKVIQNGAGDAEWNFLMGSANYYKGWLNDAMFYFGAACRLDPANREYNAALKNLTSRGQGEMPGNPYKPKQNSGDDAALDCACSTCNMLCCMDMCCKFGRGC